MVHIHQGVGVCLCQPTANLLGDGNGIQRELLIGALGLDLEALLYGKLVAEVFHDSLENRVQVLFAGAAAAHRRNTENRAAGFPRAV